MSFSKSCECVYRTTSIKPVSYTEVENKHSLERGVGKYCGKTHKIFNFLILKTLVVRCFPIKLRHGNKKSPTYRSWGKSPEIEKTDGI